MRRPLIEPDRLPVVGTPREDAGGPLVVALAQLGIPWPGVRGAVIEEIEIGVVGDPAPHRPAADLPGVVRPRRDAEVFAFVGIVEGVEVRADQHVLVGTGVVGAPGELARLRVERGDPSAHAHLAAAVADEHFVLHDERRHRDRLAVRIVRDVRDPHFLAALGVDRARAPVQRVEKNLPVRVRRAAIHDVAARHSLCRRRELARAIHPLHAAGIVEIDGDEIVRKWRDEIHRVADDQRPRFMSAIVSRRDRPRDAQLLHVRRVDLIEPAEARRGVVLRGHEPLGVVFLELDEIGVVGSIGATGDEGRRQKAEGRSEKCERQVRSRASSFCLLPSAFCLLPSHGNANTYSVLPFSVYCGRSAIAPTNPSAADASRGSRSFDTIAPGHPPTPVSIAMYCLPSGPR